MTNGELSDLLVKRGEIILDLIEALRECEVEIDMATDEKYPPNAHPMLAVKNAQCRANNPARIALDAYDKER